MIPILKPFEQNDPKTLPETFLWHGDVEGFLDTLPIAPIFDLAITSPPYNIGKKYEKRQTLDNYLHAHQRIISKIFQRMKPTGSMCWQLGNFIDKKHGGKSTTILPLDLVFHNFFQQAGAQLRNRIIWRFGHGLSCKHRFSGRYEVVMWYTLTDNYTFDLDAVRVPQKYPGKRHFKGPNVGRLSGNPKGKNPEDVWDIPNVKSNHVEKTEHPCQFPVALVDRFVLATTKPGQVVFDPFAGVASTGVAALLHKRRFWGCEIDDKYLNIAKKRLTDAQNGHFEYRPFEKPIHDHTTSNLATRPAE